VCQVRGDSARDGWPVEGGGEDVKNVSTALLCRPHMNAGPSEKKWKCVFDLII
jgi:hypothetical protein